MSNSHFHLRTKDQEVLDFILNNKIATCKNIHLNLYPDKNPRSINKIVSKLLSVDLIDRTFVPNDNKRSTTAYHLTEKGLKFALPYLKEIKNVKLKSDKVKHDFALTEIRHRLNRLQNVKKVWSENEIILASEFEYNDALDDFKKLRSDTGLLINRKEKDFYLAIEYEASQKRKDRIKNKFIDYYQKKRINAVIYICKNQSILNCLRSNENNFNDSNRGKIYYITLSDFLDTTKKPVFKNRLDKELVAFS